MQIASEHRLEVLRIAQWCARQIARENGEVTSDDVAMEMTKMNADYDLLQNAAGSVFRADFEWTGKVIKSSRVSTHGRCIRVWRLKEGS
jgi:hypothetical protein